MTGFYNYRAQDIFAHLIGVKNLRFFSQSFRTLKLRFPSMKDPEQKEKNLKS